jgi:HopA1 effector protein family
MQTLNSVLTKDLDSISPQLLDTLLDIVNKVQIESHFSISHVNYKPLELPPEIVKRLKKIPVNTQSQYLNKQLKSFIYGIYYNASLRTSLALDTNSASRELSQNIGSNTLFENNMEFLLKLHESNVGEGYFDSGWRVLRQEDNDRIVVKKNGLTLHIERYLHLQAAEHSATVGEVVSIRLPRNLIQDDFYVAISNLGLVNFQNIADNSTKVRIYFNFSPEGAVAFMKGITEQLNKIKIPFVFKVLLTVVNYERYNSGIIYFERNNYQTVRQVIQTIYQRNREYFQMEIPLFTKFLAPGVGLAEEPDCKFSSQESFGMNRCQIVALGLLEAWKKGAVSPEVRMTSILKSFAMFGVNLQHPYLNKDSEDIYSPLNCPI